ncbi:MAG: nucleoside triphosphate pyrophosphatase [Pseudomonadota bacterium]|nr:nucleoside triphosphate pyrophosphatase [Pseudomonadota bacterium]
MNKLSFKLVLASSSPYRRELLSRVIENFEVTPASIDETAHPNEKPSDLAVRLAFNKANKIATVSPRDIVIGSDQVASVDNKILGKPGNAANAIKQLSECSGKEVFIYTAISVLHKANQFSEYHLDITTVSFRELSQNEIERYVELDEPWDCAGGFRSELRGVLLFESIQSNDPNAIIGLPLIWLAGSLKRAGVLLL